MQGSDDRINSKAGEQDRDSGEKGQPAGQEGYSKKQWDRQQGREKKRGTGSRKTGKGKNRDREEDRGIEKKRVGRAAGQR